VFILLRKSRLKSQNYAQNYLFSRKISPKLLFLHFFYHCSSLQEQWCWNHSISIKLAKNIFMLNTKFLKNIWALTKFTGSYKKSVLINHRGNNTILKQINPLCFWSTRLTVLWFLKISIHLGLPVTLYMLNKTDIDFFWLD